MAETIPDSEITPRAVYLNRRAFMRAGLLSASVAGTALVYRRLNVVNLDTTEMPPIAGLITAPHANGFWVDEALTPRASILNYNNFYEFTTDKDGVAGAAAGFKTDGWQVSVGGLVHKPRVFDIDDLKKLSPPEERVYRMRCVEAWSMVIPWAGFSLSKLARRGRADGRGEVRRFRDAERPGADAGPEDGRPRVALRRRASPRRSHAPAHAPRHRALRRGSAAAGRRAGPARDSVEVRLQGHQVDRQDHAHGHAAADDVEHRGAGRNTDSSAT